MYQRNKIPTAIIISTLLARGQSLYIRIWRLQLLDSEAKAVPRLKGLKPVDNTTVTSIKLPEEVNILQFIMLEYILGLKNDTKCIKGPLTHNSIIQPGILNSSVLFFTHLQIELVSNCPAFKWHYELHL